MTLVALALLAVAWLYFHPRFEWSDLSISTRGLDCRADRWERTWYTWFSLRCWSCGAWGGCGEPGHLFCGVCRECLEIMETDWDEDPDEGGEA